MEMELIFGCELGLTQCFWLRIKIMHMQYDMRTLAIKVIGG